MADTIMERILEKFGLKYDDLKSDERDTLDTWMQVLSRNEITTSDIKQYITQMRESVELKIGDVNQNSKEDIFLKARLRNYLLLEAFMTSPDRAKTAIDRMLSGIANGRKV